MQQLVALTCKYFEINGKKINFVARRGDIDKHTKFVQTWTK